MNMIDVLAASNDATNMVRASTNTDPDNGLDRSGTRETEFVSCVVVSKISHSQRTARTDICVRGHGTCKR